MSWVGSGYNDLFIGLGLRQVGSQMVNEALRITRSVLIQGLFSGLHQVSLFTSRLLKR